MQATEQAAHAEYQLALSGARKEDKEAAAARVRQAQGAVAEVESYIGDARVYAPITGEASSVIAEAGELVGEGYPVVAILDLSDMWVLFNIKDVASGYSCRYTHVELCSGFGARCRTRGDLSFCASRFCDLVGYPYAGRVRYPNFCGEGETRDGK